MASPIGPKAVCTLDCATAGSQPPAAGGGGGARQDVTKALQLGDAGKCRLCKTSCQGMAVVYAGWQPGSYVQGHMARCCCKNC